jgi:hypothetical protein
MQVVPATKSTINLMGAKQFAAMKPDAILVNIARGVVSLATLSFVFKRSHLFLSTLSGDEIAQKLTDAHIRICMHARVDAVFEPGG